MNISNKIIIAGAHHIPDNGGAAGRCMHMLAKGFAQSGENVTLASTHGSWDGPSNIDIDGFQAIAFGKKQLQQNPLYEMLDRLQRHLCLCLYLLRVTIQKEYKLLIFYGPVIMFPLVALCALLRKQKTVYLMADIQATAKKIPWAHKIKLAARNITDILLAKLSSAIVVLGTSVLEKHYYSLAPKTKQIRIWAPTDIQIFNTGNGERAKKRYNIHDKKVVSYIGAIDMLEGVHVLIAAISLLVTKYPEIILILAGPENNIDRVVGKKINFHEMVDKAGLSDNVIFTGYLSLKEVLDLLAASDVLVMPKIDHPMNNVASPIKIAEYLAAGRAVVSSNICELDKILKHMDNVYFCTPGNPEEFAIGIEMLLNDNKLRDKLSANAHKVAAMNFDCCICTQRILSAIQ
ncbi:MAG: glycosyltransferase [Candidatus Electrothrix gigas]